MINKVLLVAVFATVLLFIYLNKDQLSSTVNLSKLVSKEGALMVDPNLRLSLRELLRVKDFAELDRELSKLEDEFDAGAISESDLNYIYTGFQVIDPELDGMFVEWLASNNGWESRLAYATYLYGMAWEWRGHAFWNKVPEHNRDKFRDLNKRADDLLSESVSGTKENSLVMGMKIGLANDSGNSNLQELIKTALAQWPKSEIIYKTAIRTSSERWGGDKFRHAQLIHDLDILISSQNSENKSGVIEYYNAYDAYLNKDFVRAIGDYQNALKRSPNNTGYLLGLARAYIGNKQFEQGLTTANQLIKYWPSSMNAREVRVDALVGLGKDQQAVKDLSYALEHSPYDTNLNLTASGVFARLGNKSKALLHLERSGYFKEFDVDAIGQMAFKARYDIGDHALAEKLYLKALGLRPYDVVGSYGLSTLYGDKESCNIVEMLHTYLTGCDRGIGSTNYQCAARYKNWAYSAVNHLKGHQKCPEINEFNFKF